MGVGQWEAAEFPRIDIVLVPHTRQARNQMRRQALGEWITYCVARRFATRFLFLIQDYALDRYDEPTPTLRRCWRPWLRD